MSIKISLQYYSMC